MPQKFFILLRRPKTLPKLLLVTTRVPSHFVIFSFSLKNLFQLTQSLFIPMRKMSAGVAVNQSYWSG